MCTADTFSNTPFKHPTILITRSSTLRDSPFSTPSVTHSASKMYGRIRKIRSVVEVSRIRPTSLQRDHYITILDVKSESEQVYDTRKVVRPNTGSLFQVMMPDIEARRVRLLPSSVGWMLDFLLGRVTLRCYRNNYIKLSERTRTLRMIVRTIMDYSIRHRQNRMHPR